MHRTQMARPIWLGAIALAIQFVAGPAQGVVTIANCGGAGSDFGTSCSLQELVDRGLGMPSITIDQTVFSEFVATLELVVVTSGTLGLISAIRVDPVDSNSRPGLTFTDTGTTWDRTGFTLARHRIKFRIARPVGSVIGGRRLYARFGDISYFDLAEGENSSINVHDSMIQYMMPGANSNATVQCLASELTCANTTRRDSHASVQPQDGSAPWNDAQAEVEVNVTAEKTFAVTGHAELDSFSYQLELPYVAIHATVPDVNGNGSPEIVVIQQGSITAEMRDGRTAALLSTNSFLDNTYTPVAVGVLPDLDGNGDPELAVLGRKINASSDPNDPNTVAIVEIQNLGNSPMPRQILLPQGFLARGMKVVNGDADHNNVPELAVLLTDLDNGRERVQIFNAFGARNQSLVLYALALQVLDLTIVDDADGNNVPEVAVLAGVSGIYMIDVRNVAGLAQRQVALLPLNHAPAGLTSLTSLADVDGNGIPEVAVLLREIGTDILKVRVQNAVGGTYVDTMFYGSMTQPGPRFGPELVPLGLEGIPDTDNDTVPEIAVLLDRQSNAHVSVDIRNPYTALTNKRVLTFPPGYNYSPRSLAFLGDADGDGVSEVSVLLIRTDASQILVQSRNADVAAQLPHSTNFRP